MSKELEIKSMFGTRWTFRALNSSGGLAIHAYKPGNKSDTSDVFVGLSEAKAMLIRDYLVEQFGPGEGYVKVDEGLVNATAEEVPERKFKVGDRIRVKAGDQSEPTRMHPGNGWIGRAGTITSVNPDGEYHYEARMDGDTTGSDLYLFEDEVERYVEPTLGDALAEYPLGTIIHFDRDTASGTWVKRRDAWYSSKNAVQMSFLLDHPASRWPFKVIYNPVTDN